MITSTMSTCVYVDDYEAALEFYSTALGLTRTIDMGKNATFFAIGDNPNGLYLEGGYEPVARSEKSSGVSAMFLVDSAHEVYDRLKHAGARLVHDKPQHMGGSNYWFRFYDPASNILEIVQSESK